MIAVGHNDRYGKFVDGSTSSISVTGSNCSFVLTNQLEFKTAQQNVLNAFFLHKNDCYRTTNANPVLVNKWMNQKETPDKSLSGFIKCLLIKANILNDDLVVNATNLKKILKIVPDYVLNKSIKQCQQERGKTPCESSYKIFMCICEHIKNTMD
ncbi:hypothetical protein RN001_000770 [Aquatica leii]|uniref:Uncharacterized protein n=1 Tax=Aquatica leii TaxID=1421715 RepID=A0AAN7PFC9_9COLE|nr:hypothetical protein RN001_000770 [Aquatica leii]